MKIARLMAIAVVAGATGFARAGFTNSVYLDESYDAKQPLQDCTVSTLVITGAGSVEAVGGNGTNGAEMGADSMFYLIEVGE